MRAASQINGQPLDAWMIGIGFGARLLTHLAHVHADAHPGQVGFDFVRLLQPQREHNCCTRRLECQKAAVAGPVDDATGRTRS